MHNAPNIKRRSLLQNIFGFSLLISATGLSALSSCSDSGSDTNDPNSALDDGGSCIVNGTEIDIQNVHTPNHTLLISKDDINAGVTKTYTLENNGSGHIHTITLTAADFSSLRTNTVVRLTSTNDASHTHAVAIGCA